MLGRSLSRLAGQFFAAGLALLPNVSLAQTITEFVIPTVGSFPDGITTGPDGALWFTEFNQGKIGRITTAGVFTEFSIPTLCCPYRITMGPDGALWFSEQYGDKIGRITTAGVITEFPGGDTPQGIITGPDGALWFTLQGAVQGVGKIGRITSAGAIAEFPIPTVGGMPWDIATGPDGALWFTEWGGNKIGRITTAGAISEFPVPTTNSSPNGITAGPDGALWFTETEAGKIGRITTAGAITEFPIPSAGSGPVGITTGPDNALWFTEHDVSKIGRITTDGIITELPVAVFTPYGITTGPDGALWFTQDAAGRIGRLAVTVVPPPVAVNETATTKANTPIRIDLTFGSTGSPTSATLVGTPVGGTVNGFPSTTVTFAPTTGFTGSASFQFTLSNAGGTSNTATAAVTVLPPPPAAISQFVSTRINKPLTINLANGATGNPTSATIIGAITGGTLGALTGTTATFTPDKGYRGTATFQFTLSNETGPSNVATANIIVGPPPPANIYLNGALVTGATTVAVGQQIVLTTAPGPESGQTQSWNIGGRPVNSYTLTPGDGTVAPACADPNNSNPSCNNKVITYIADTDRLAPSVTFYWVIPGTYVVTYRYTLADGLEAKSTVTINAVGPTNVNVVNNPVGIIPQPFDNTTGALFPPPAAQLWYLACGTPSASLGVVFGQGCVNLTVRAQIPSGYQGGNYQWVQVLDRDVLLLEYGIPLLLQLRHAKCTIGVLPAQSSPFLDNSYPFKHRTTNDAQTADVPVVPMATNDLSIARSFRARMYVEWTPNTTNAIPVPLGYVSWGFDAAARKQPDGTWSLTSQPMTPNVDPFVAGNRYPSWKSVSLNSVGFSSANCQ
jgi:virginiamycin B lyase